MCHSKLDYIFNCSWVHTSTQAHFYTDVQIMLICIYEWITTSVPLQNIDPKLSSNYIAISVLSSSWHIKGNLKKIES